jgi:hypothetical protein
MRATLSALVIVTALSCTAAGPASGAMGAYLSWSASDPHVSDLSPAPPFGNLYFWFTDFQPAFYGAELDLLWDPPGDQNTCFAKLGTFFPTSTSCTYLNRGANVPVTTIDEPGHYRVAWSNTSVDYTCTSGVAARIQFEFDGCADPSGCFTLGETTVALLCLGLSPQCHTIVPPDVFGPPATVNGGGGHNYCVTPVAPSRWGSIKAIFAR